MIGLGLFCQIRVRIIKLLVTIEKQIYRCKITVVWESRQSRNKFGVCILLHNNFVIDVFRI